MSFTLNKLYYFFCVNLLGYLFTHLGLIQLKQWLIANDSLLFNLMGSLNHEMTGSY